MKTVFLYIALFFSLVVFAQNEQLAANYYDKGEFEKALISFQELLKNQSGNSVYFLKMIDCYQQLGQFDAAEKALQERLDKYRQANILVELGANFQLKKDEDKAKKYFEQALDRIKKNPNEVYGVAGAFERKALIDYALKAYEMAVSLDQKFNFNFQMALLYGQKGNTDMMIEKFLTESYNNPPNLIAIQNQFSRFILEDGEATFNEALRKALLLRVQKNQDIFWNQYLSWFYVQQKEYGKAFIQEKAIYRRNPETFSNIVNLAQLSIAEGEFETAKEILAFVLENTQDLDLQIQAHYFLTEMKIKNASEKEFKTIEGELEQLVKQFGISPYSLSLQILQAHFVTFHLKNSELGKTILKKTLELPLNQYQIAEVKMELADILLYEEKFNQALIYYSQIEEDLKNDVVGHEASLKAAKTSYFKGDFDWALSQFKVLKTASTQLIANDALEYFLLINDNKVADSTQTALKQFARADYLLYQNKNQEALIQFQAILKNFKGDEIESITLLRLGKTYEKLGDYNSALSQYQSIIITHQEGIYIDEALYFSAEIYNKQLKDVDKAKPLYEKIVFNHEDSIFFIDARKKFRQLRGDTNL
ncbi:tetratricopeptide repeat protein [Flavobacterium sp. GT3R68]|uniref:tetratricopeptide repeat protein n=1 Tax=Flavobacterium sp. GT3R68 TaxID=2594437 RepID=UPI000F875FFB|nr:tetratricopeptide repeat protein [Flavobacterium sp. GT3R68]RTY90834.1 tetratricopeptide repeat protein [Flavobacterium sp. GSN2]TRW93826.1 tetratricopeptide repeat protein [Flavobacterium sp. GT3R68]